jgi:phosphoglycolate phosphatase
MPDPCTRRLAVFDFDGTLADTWRDIETALNRTLAEAGRPLVTGPEVRGWIGQGVLPLLERAMPGAPPGREEIDRLYAAFRVHYERCCLDTTELYPGIEACLDALQDTQLAVLSNKPQYFLERIIDGLGLKGRFDLVIGGDTLDVKKPDPRALQIVIERLGVRPTALWMIGDSAIDVETGRAARARTIGCAWGMRPREELRQAGADLLVEHPSEIPFAILD